MYARPVWVIGSLFHDLAREIHLRWSALTLARVFGATLRSINVLLPSPSLPYRQPLDEKPGDAHTQDPLPRAWARSVLERHLPHRKQEAAPGVVVVVHHTCQGSGPSVGDPLQCFARRHRKGN